MFFFPLAITSNNCGVIHERYFCHAYSLVCTYKSRISIWNRVRKSSNIGQDYKTLISVSAYLLTAIDNFFFWKGEYVHLNLKLFWYFLIFRDLRRKYFGNLWGSSNTKFVILSGSILVVANRTCTKTLKSSKIMWTGYK